MQGPRGHSGDGKGQGGFLEHAWSTWALNDGQLPGRAGESTAGRGEGAVAGDGGWGGSVNVLCEQNAGETGAPW